MHYIFLCRKKGNMEYLKLNELTKKKLEETYIVIYAIKNEINVKKQTLLKKIIFTHSQVLTLKELGIF